MFTDKVIFLQVIQHVLGSKSFVRFVNQFPEIYNFVYINVIYYYNIDLVHHIEHLERNTIHLYVCVKLTQNLSF